MSYRYIVASRFLYADHEKVAAEIESAFGATITQKSPCVVGSFSSVDANSVFEWVDAAEVSEAFVVLSEDGEMLARAGPHAVRIFGPRDDAE